MSELSSILRLLPALAPALLAGCSGGSSPAPGEGTGSPMLRVLSVVQDRDTDPTGATLQVEFSEPIDADDAAEPTFFHVSGATVLASARSAPAIVTLSVDRAVVPGDRVLDVRPGLRAESGVETEAIEDLTITTTDDIPPTALTLAAEAVAGLANDTLTVTFDDHMVEAEVEQIQRWAVEAPLGTPVDLTGARVEYDPVTRAATLTLAGSQGLEAETGVGVIVSQVRDLGGNVIETMAFGVSALLARVEGDVAPPTLVSAAPGAAPGTLQLVFSEPLLPLDSADIVQGPGVAGVRVVLHDGVADFEAVSLARNLDGYGALVGFGTTPVAGDTVDVFGVADAAGNTLFPTLGASVVARDVGAPALAPGASTVTAISGERNDVLQVVFDRPLHPDGLDDDFRYGLLAGFFVDLATARFEWDGAATVTWHLADAPDHDVVYGFEYLLAVVNLRSAQGVLIDNITIEQSLFGEGDATAPALLSARIDPLSADSVIAVFDEALRPAALAAPANYTHAGSAALSVESLGPRAARVVFPGAVTLGAPFEVSAAGLTDRAGNRASSSATIAVQSADVTAPALSAVELTAVEGSGGDTVRLTFSEQVDLETALDAAALSLTVDGQSVSLADAEAVYDSVQATVTWTLPSGRELPFGAPFVCTASGVRDLAGLSVATGPLAGFVTGDNTAPTQAAAFVDWRANAAGRVVRVELSEPLSASAASPLAWSASGGVLVQQVLPLGERRYRITLSAALGPLGTLTLHSPTDLAGNVGADLVLDPHE